MNRSNLLLVSLICFTQASLYAMSGERQLAFWDNVDTARAGFIVGYVTGLVPVGGQAIFALLLGLASDDPNANYNLFAGSAAVGHAAGVATIVTAACCMCKLTSRLEEQAINNRIDSSSGINQRLNRLEEHVGPRLRIQMPEYEQLTGEDLP